MYLLPLGVETWKNQMHFPVMESDWKIQWSVNSVKCELYYFLFMFNSFFKETWYFAESTTCHTSSCSYGYTKVESVYETCIRRCHRPSQMVEITVLVWGLHQAQVSLNLIFLNLWLTYKAWHRISWLIKEFWVHSICTNRIYYLKKFKITSNTIMLFVFGMHWSCICIKGTVNLDYQCEYAFGLVCRGLDWAIQNLLVQFGTTANYIFLLMMGGNPSIQVLSKSNS